MEEKNIREFLKTARLDNYRITNDVYRRGLLLKHLRRTHRGAAFLLFPGQHSSAALNPASNSLHTFATTG